MVSPTAILAVESYQNQPWLLAFTAQFILPPSSLISQQFSLLNTISSPTPADVLVYQTSTLT